MSDHLKAIAILLVILCIIGLVVLVAFFIPWAFLFVMALAVVAIAYAAVLDILDIVRLKSNE